MQTLQSPDAGRRVVPAPLATIALGSLHGTPNADHFHAWRGRSGRRYVVGVHPVDRADPDVGLPRHAAFVLVAARHEGCAPRAVLVAAIERDGDRRAAIARGLAAGAEAWHVHLLAADRRERGAAAADLSARDLDLPMALSA